MANAKSLCYYYDRYILVGMATSYGKCSLSNATNIRSDMIKYIIPLCFLASCASKQLISDKASIDGAIKNLDELNRWVYYDYDHGEISDKTMREYDNLIELIKYQLEDIKYKK
jgi:hypothetical protein